MSKRNSSAMKKGTKLYHGTNKTNIKSIRKNGLQPTTDTSTSYGLGIYLTDNPKIAQDYADDLKDGVVLNIKVTQDLTLYIPTQEEALTLVDLYKEDQMNYVRKLLSDKYDGFKIFERSADGNEIVLFDNKKISISK